MLKILGHAGRFAVGWATLFGFWLLLVGTNSGLELLCGAVAALLGGVAALTVRTSGLLNVKIDRRLLVHTLKVPLQVVVELWWIAVALARGRRPHGAYVAMPFDAGGDDAEGRGRRGVAGVADSISPNVVFVDADCERDLALRHALDPKHAPKSVP
jgi:hypothetical protein